MVLVERISYIKIFAQDNDEFIVYNTKKDFPNGHIHIRKFHTAKYLANLVVHEQSPRGTDSKYIWSCYQKLSNKNRKHSQPEKKRHRK